MAEVLNRPYIDGKPVEGPEPFTSEMTIAEGLAIDAISPSKWQNSHFTLEQLQKLYVFRCLYPVNLYSSEPMQYPPEVNTGITIIVETDLGGE